MDDRQPMRILVAGATENLGKALIPVLRERETEVVALVRPGSQSRLQPLENHIRATREALSYFPGKRIGRITLEGWNVK